MEAGQKKKIVLRFLVGLDLAKEMEEWDAAVSAVSPVSAP